MRLLPDYPNCFVCGKANTAGLQIAFYRDGDLVVANCVIPETYAGYQGLVHGGIMSSILDEALGRIVGSITRHTVVTGNLDMRFHRPISTGLPVHIEASFDEKQRTHHHFWTASGKMVDVASGQTCASATGRFFTIPGAKEEEMLLALRLQGVDRPITFDDL